MRMAPRWSDAVARVHNCGAGTLKCQKRKRCRSPRFSRRHERWTTKGAAAPKETAESEAAPVSPATDADAAQPVAEADTGATEAAKSTPAAPAKPLAPGERPNVKDILAMARAGKSAARRQQNRPLQKHLSPNLRQPKRRRKNPLQSQRPRPRRPWRKIPPAFWLPRENRRSLGR